LDVPEAEEIDETVDIYGQDSDEEIIDEIEEIEGQGGISVAIDRKIEPSPSLITTQSEDSQTRSQTTGSTSSGESSLESEKSKESNDFEELSSHEDEQQQFWLYLSMK
jgi:spore cortex formation protein SpoVR/YcgB (stage V sporulation)